MLHQEKKSETKTITTVVREWITCDMCNSEVKKGPFDIREGQALLRIGSSYPECGSVTETQVDLCEKCFLSKLVPWLESQGATVQRVDRDW